MLYCSLACVDVSREVEITHSICALIILENLCALDIEGVLADSNDYYSYLRIYTESY
jgi:hypothetical protein